MEFNSVVRLKGIKDGIMVIASKAEFDDILSQTLEKLDEVNEFFLDGSGRVVFYDLQTEDANKIKLEQEIRRMLGDDIKIEYTMGDEKEEQDNTSEKDKFYYGTLRSGQSIKSPGNLVVVGDVNPGAELVAAGNIVVMGILRGIVHAGCGGDREASVSAARMAPTQIRIADIITRPPDGEKMGEWFPEIAYIKDGNIYIDGYLSKK